MLPYFGLKQLLQLYGPMLWFKPTTSAISNSVMMAAAIYNGCHSLMSPLLSLIFIPLAAQLLSYVTPSTVVHVKYLAGISNPGLVFILVSPNFMHLVSPWS